MQLKLTPTIPVRKNSDGLYVYVTFYLPDGLWLVNNKDKCIVEIKETEEVKVSIGATCTTLHGLKNLKVISPKIMNQKGFWSFYGLPTIWVCIVFLFVFFTILLLLFNVSLSSERILSIFDHATLKSYISAVMSSSL